MVQEKSMKLSKFFKVMPRILWTFFSGTGYNSNHSCAINFIEKWDNILSRLCCLCIGQVWSWLQESSVGSIQFCDCRWSDDDVQEFHREFPSHQHWGSVWRRRLGCFQSDHVCHAKHSMGWWWFAGNKHQPCQDWHWKESLQYPSVKGIAYVSLDDAFKLALYNGVIQTQQAGLEYG